MITTCRYFPSCRGCDDWLRSDAEQQKNKTDDLSQRLQKAQLVYEKINYTLIQSQQLRHRFDFTISLNITANDSLKSPIFHFGLYDRDRNIIDLDECLQLSPELQKIYSEFRIITQTIHSHHPQAPRLKKGSARLRVGPTGLKGLWLDLANQDIKKLLDDGRWIKELLQAGFYIEIGQKGKSVQIIKEQLKLSQPEMKTWFSTHNKFNDVLQIQGLVSDFTQPSWLSGQALVSVINSWINKIKRHDLTTPHPKPIAIEFGPGLGPFTLPLLSWGYSVHAYEFQQRLADGLKQNAQLNHLEQDLHVHVGDFQNQSLSENLTAEIVLVNPPRSGLKQFTKSIIQRRARFCFYISCFPESMIEDLKPLTAAGYRIKELSIIDQFPKTNHYETCAFLEIE